MAYGLKWDEQSVSDFSADYLLESQSFAHRRDRALGRIGADDLVINVRRGDYYGTEHEPEFGMRIEPYVLEAVKRHRARRPVHVIHLVSDDMDWCRDHFNSAFPGAEVHYDRLGDSAFDDLAMLSSARRLVLANSTFSYWGGYLSYATWGPETDVVVPGFHQRSLQVSGGYRRFHMPSWELIEDLPGGWQHDPEPGAG